MIWIWILIILLATLPAIFFKKKFGIEVQGPLCLWRTKKGLGFLKRMSKYKNFWKHFADIGLVFCFGFFGAAYLILSRKKKDSKTIFVVLIYYLIFLIASFLVLEPMVFFGKAVGRPDFLFVLFIGGFGIFVFYVLAWAAFLTLSEYAAGISPIPKVQPLIPGVHIPGALIQIPLSAIIGIIILAAVHEFAHGIVAMVEKIKVKSMGIVTIGIFPIGAFSEPDEKQLKKTNMRKRLRVFSAGSMANFVTGFAFFALLIPAQLLITPVLHSNYYLNVGGVAENSSAYFANITTGTNIYNYELLSEPQTPFSYTTLETDMGNITIQRDENGVIGLTEVSVEMKSDDFGFWSLFYLLEIITWTAALNFLVGMFNFMPLAILDGARIFDDFVNFFYRKLGFKKRKKLGAKLLKWVSIFILILLLINIAPFFI